MTFLFEKKKKIKKKNEYIAIKYINLNLLAQWSKTGLVFLPWEQDT